MTLDSFMGFQNLFQAHPIIFFLIVAWSLYWKGMALWKSAREGSEKWFIAILLINLLGILEILYIYIFSKKKSPSEPTA